MKESARGRKVAKRKGALNLEKTREKCNMMLEGGNKKTHFSLSFPSDLHYSLETRKSNI